MIKTDGTPTIAWARDIDLGRKADCKRRHYAAERARRQTAVNSALARHRRNWERVALAR
jgi:hypothetical protein